MFKRIFVAVLAVGSVLTAASCQQQPSVKEIVLTGESDKRFEELAKEYVAELLKTNPEWATRLGDHSYDGELDDYSAEGITKNREMRARHLAEPEKIPIAELNRINNVDYRILKHNLRSGLFQIDELKEAEWNPLVYNVGGAINSLVARDFGPLKERLVSVKLRLEKITGVISAAKANLRNPPKVHTETAIQQNKGVISLITGDVKHFAEEAGMTDEIKPAMEKAVEALEAYGTWLEEDLLPRSNGDFRIGAEKYGKKLQFALQSDLTKEEILNRAETDLEATRKRMFEVALPIYKRQFPDEKDEDKLSDAQSVIKAVLNKLAEDHPDNDSIVKRAQGDVEETTKFVREHNLVTVPDEPLEVIEMPEFARGTAVAYFDSAGPFEKKNETFYAIAPTPKDWDKKRRDSFYREYNNYMVKNLTVHEAMPGHYLQIMHANKFEAPTMIRAIHRSGTFTEGWAVYSEQLMAEKGYGGPEVEMQQLKMKLRVIINAIIDQMIHAGSMTEKEALDLMMNKGFQEEGEASGKWKRANLTSVQLSTYYVGSIEVNDIRKAYIEANQDEKDAEKIMHDRMLSLGSPAPMYVRELLGLTPPKTAE